VIVDAVGKLAASHAKKALNKTGRYLSITRESSPETVEDLHFPKALIETGKSGRLLTDVTRLTRLSKHTAMSKMGIRRAMLSLRFHNTLRPTDLLHDLGGNT
jgi:hypothetical protein